MWRPFQTQRSLSRWFRFREARNAYAVYRRSDGAWAHTPWFDQREYDSGPLRIDAAPKWNRSGDQILFSSLTEEPEPTRQLFLIRIKTND